MSYECFEVDINSQIAHIRLCRPDKRNSMIAAFWSELPQIVNEIDRRALARVIVISSTGPHFSSGMDVEVFSQPMEDEESDSLSHRTRSARFYDTVLRLQDTFTALEQARMPVLVAIQGGCVGAGVDMVTACDMRYVSADAFFTIFETNIAMTADVGTFPRLCKLIPDGMVRELAYTGRRLPAEEALSIGLVNRVFANQAEMVEGVLEIAAEISHKAPLAVSGCKKMILHARDHTVVDSLDYVGLWNASFLQREEINEAMQANQQKRAGTFAELPKRLDSGMDLP